MQQETARILTTLRKEKGITQKEAAQQLRLSQGLLSHYERGIRRPSYEFLADACRFYSVTADYMLGLTPHRQPQPLPREEQEKREPPAHPAGRGRRNVTHTLNREFTLGALRTLYDLMDDPKHRQFALEAQTYISIAVYKVFRHLIDSNSANLPGSFFKLPDSSFLEAGNAAAQMCELRMKLLSARMSARKEAPPLIKREEVMEGHGQDAFALMHVLGEAETEIDIGAKNIASRR